MIYGFISQGPKHTRRHLTREGRANGREVASLGEFYSLAGNCLSLPVKQRLYCQRGLVARAPGLPAGLALLPLATVPSGFRPFFDGCASALGSGAAMTVRDLCRLILAHGSALLSWQCYKII